MCGRSTPRGLRTCEPTRTRSHKHTHIIKPYKFAQTHTHVTLAIVGPAPPARRRRASGSMAAPRPRIGYSWVMGPAILYNNDIKAIASSYLNIPSPSVLVAVLKTPSAGSGHGGACARGSTVE